MSAHETSITSGDAAIIPHSETNQHLEPKHKVELYEACRVGDVDKLEYILGLYPDIPVDTIRYARNETLLHWAASFGAMRIARTLLDKHHSSVHVKDSQGNTPLHTASWKGYAGLAHMLIMRYGARVDAPDKDGLTALHEACWNGYTKIASMLIEHHRADVNSKDNSGNTPLHIACQIGQADTVRFLLDEGADPKEKNNKGLVAAQTFISSGLHNEEEFIQLLQAEN